MDDIATYGILSKLRLNKSYKSLDLKDSELNILEDWIQDKIMELDKDTTALIWDMLQDNFYREEINVHCMGMTIRLPKGATIVDLAFKVDPENAIYLTDATIDHKKVPYFYKLLDRNVVDLEFGDVQTVKSDWLNNVVLFKSIIQIYKYVKK
jgi:GTP pyrophosphokinase